MTIWLGKYLGKSEHAEKFNFWRPFHIACRKRQSSMEGDVKWHKFTKNDKNNGEIQIGNIMWGVACHFKAQYKQKWEFYTLQSNNPHEFCSSAEKLNF